MISRPPCGAAVVMATRGTRPIKLVVVGDGTVGKTCLLIAYTSRSFPAEEYSPTIFENYSGIMEIDNVNVSLALWDTAGQEEYERLRPLSYPCIDNMASYNNIVTKWQPEIKHYCNKAPYILVGTKADLRNEKSGVRYVTKAMGKKLAAKIRAVKYIETSAKNLDCVDEAFEEAVRAVLNPKYSSPILKCSLL
ncbi:RhoL [Cordylochernes scorpioides]|uniref:RhoL n=1 Tax=Cordylochernes scorpioides TaxID=51811 RepID=A0ABY6LC65_9ARAC|nr:RhoL [Cordylochernes scorpioides]